MHLETLSLTGFRNYRSQEVSFAPGLNLLFRPIVLVAAAEVLVAEEADQHVTPVAALGA